MLRDQVAFLRCRAATDRCEVNQLDNFVGRLPGRQPLLNASFRRFDVIDDGRVVEHLNDLTERRFRVARAFAGGVANRLGEGHQEGMIDRTARQFDRPRAGRVTREAFRDAGDR